MGRRDSVMVHALAEASKYGSVLGGRSVVRCTLSLDEVDGMATTTRCHGLTDPELLGRLFEAAAALSAVQPVVVRAGDDTYAARVDRGAERGPAGTLACELDPPFQGTLPERVTVTMLVFEGSYAFAARVLGPHGAGGLQLALPTSVWLRRRRVADRLTLAAPLAAEVWTPTGLLAADVINLSEQGALLSLEADAATPVDAKLPVQLWLPSGRVAVVGTVRWTELDVGRRLAGVEFSSVHSELRQKLGERRGTTRQDLVDEPACRVTDEREQTSIGDVLDLSETGARIRLGPGAELQAGSTCRVEITMGGVPLRTAAEVRWLAPAKDDVVVGLRFTTVLGPGRRQLVDFLLPRFQPGTGPVKPDDLDAAFDVYDAVNFCGTTGKGDTAARTLGVAKEVWRRILEEGRDIGHMVCVRESGQIVGVACTSRLYHSTWLSHSMAAVRSEALLPAELLRMAHMHQMENEASSEFLMAFYLRHKDYAQRYYEQAMNAVPDQHLQFRMEVAVLDHDLTAANLARLSALRTGSDTVGRASPKEEQEFIDGMRARFPALYLQVIDLDKGVSLGGLTEQYRAIGLQRERSLLVQRRNGKAFAFALLEMTSPGLTLNGAPDGYWLFAADPADDAVTGTRAVVPLIESACIAYAGHRRSAATGFLVQPPAADLDLPGVRVIPQLMVWCGHRDAGPDVRRFWQGVYGAYKLARLGLLGARGGGGG